mgnify:CR=1 FL=1
MDEALKVIRDHRAYLLQAVSFIHCGDVPDRKILLKIDNIDEIRRKFQSLSSVQHCDRSGKVVELQLDRYSRRM